MCLGLKYKWVKLKDKLRLEIEIIWKQDLWKNGGIENTWK